MRRYEIHFSSGKVLDFIGKQKKSIDDDIALFKTTDGCFIAIYYNKVDFAKYFELENE